MHCLKAGAGPELILLHGLLGHRFDLGADASPLWQRESTVYAVDALGIGESERVPGHRRHARKPRPAGWLRSWMQSASAPRTFWPLRMAEPLP